MTSNIIFNEVVDITYPKALKGGIMTGTMHSITTFP